MWPQDSCFSLTRSWDWNFLGVKSTDYTCLCCSEMKHLLGWGGTLQLGNSKECEERKTAHSSSRNRSEEAHHALGWQVWTSKRELSCFPYSTSFNCGTSPAAGWNWGSNGQNCIGGQPGEINVIFQSPYQKTRVPLTVGIERAWEEWSFIFLSATTTVDGIKGRIWGRRAQ